MFYLKNKDSLNPWNWHRWTFWPIIYVTKMRLPRKKNCQQKIKCSICSFLLIFSEVTHCWDISLQSAWPFWGYPGVRLPHFDVYGHINRVFRVNINVWNFQMFFPRHIRWTICDLSEVTSIISDHYEVTQIANVA